MIDWNLLWFVILGVLLAGYAILDGFDFGVGMLHLLAKGDQERRIMINSIGPLWDGNEVWLVTFGGALFAAFPEAYATIFSGYYEALMLVLGCLIFRAVAIEFRGKRPERWWRSCWDNVFCVASTLISFLFGVAVGSAILGIPLDERGIFRGTMLDQLSGYAIAVGLMTVAMFAMHGAFFLMLRTEGDLQERIRRVTMPLFYTFLATYAVVTFWTWWDVPRAVAAFEHFPAAWIVAVLSFLAVLNIPREMSRNRYLNAFLSSGCLIAGLVFLLGMALYPNLVSSSTNPANSLTVRNSASSEGTLKLMTLIAIVGMPFVLGYTILVYRTFGGKVYLDKHSY